MKRYIFKFENYDIPNPITTDFWHGGNLDNYEDTISHKSGRYEYGSGLYLTTHKETALKYAKGQRKLYKVTVENGVNIDDAILTMDVCREFIKKYIIRTKINIFLERLNKHIKDNSIKAFIFNNIILNGEFIKSSNAKNLRQFYIDNNIDYDIIDNAFGWHETMMVLYNMKKIVNITKITGEDRYK